MKRRDLGCSLSGVGLAFGPGVALFVIGACLAGCGSSGASADAGTDGPLLGDTTVSPDVHNDTGSSGDTGNGVDTGIGDSATGMDSASGADGGDAGCPVVGTNDGPVLGKTTYAAGPSAPTACEYQGIPYAAPPIGALRWKAPALPTAWTVPRAPVHAFDCPQPGDRWSSEDCLYLNVWAPASPSMTPAPVMVFVHGGGFWVGSGSLPSYEGSNLATATGNLVVTLNYRLGALGFLSNAALRAEDPHGSAGDYGILDQIAAFQWVHDNIAAFGGDPSRVTIFGESAGGTSMFVHLASPLSAGLFSRMIIESGAAAYHSWLAAAAPQSAADATGDGFATALGCTNPSTLLSCLRGASVANVLGALQGVPSNAPMVTWLPVVDGYVVPTDPLQAIAAGAFTKVPTVLGNNRNEGSSAFYNAPWTPTDAASYLAVEDALAPGDGAAIVAEYPISAYAGSYASAAAAALGDGNMICPTRRVARALAAGGTPAFRYDFTHVLAACPTLGAFHFEEVLFVFGNTIPSSCGGPDLSLSAPEVPLSKAMMGYWGSMASAGDPNGGGRFAWPMYDTTTEPEIVLDLTPSTETQLEKPQCDFWDGLVASFADAGSDAAPGDAAGD